MNNETGTQRNAQASKETRMMLSQKPKEEHLKEKSVMTKGKLGLMKNHCI